MRLNRLALIPFSVLWVLLAGTVEAQTTVPFTTPGTTSWTAPAGVTSATVQAWGGGGAGGGATGNPAEGGGGAGGQYAIKVIAVTPGNSYAVVVGAGGTSSTGDGGAGGDSTFNGTSVVAKGGAGGAGAASNRSGGAAGSGSTAGGIGTTVYAGGSGSSGDATNAGCQAGGAGGGGAGSGGAGGDASGNTGGSGTANGGGSGGDASNSTIDGNPGSVYGGAGGGACAESRTNRSGGAGAPGQVTITYLPTTTVTSIILAGTNPTNAASVSWTVTFGASVTGVTASNFSLVNAGLGGTPAITSVTGSGTTWTVSASTGTGTGTLGLNMVNSTSVSPTVTNLPFTGQVYTIIQICSTTPPWYNPSWQYRKAITIDHTKVGGTLANFPVLVSATDANLQANAQASGNDILFTDASGTAKLAHEVELYTSASGQLIAWVSVPSVSASVDTVIYMYYGNPAAPAQQNPSGVWDANFSGVWHLKETGNGSAGEYKDSSANANNARGGNGSSGATPTRVAGKIGYGQSFNGSQLINGATSSMPAVNGNQTMSFWYQVATNPPSARTNLFTLRTSGGGSANQGVFVGPVSGSCSAYASPIGATQWGGTCTIDANAPAAGSWHYFVFTHSGTTNVLYMDGAQVATNTTALQTGAIGEFIWGSYTTTPAEPFTGQMDETRVSSTARSAAWIQAEYNNQNSPATLPEPRGAADRFLFVLHLLLDHLSGRLDRGDLRGGAGHDHGEGFEQRAFRAAFRHHPQYLELDRRGRLDRAGGGRRNALGQRRQQRGGDLRLGRRREQHHPQPAPEHPRHHQRQPERLQREGRKPGAERRLEHHLRQRRFPCHRQRHQRGDDRNPDRRQKLEHGLRHADAVPAGDPHRYRHRQLRWRDPEPDGERRARRGAAEPDRRRERAERAQ